MIGHLDLAAGVSGDMLLGCLVDAGWPLAQLRATVQSLGLPAGAVEVHAHRVRRGPLAATWVEVRCAPQKEHRRLGDIARLLGESSLSAELQEDALAVFRRLARAEAEVHGMDVDEVHFHEVGALDALVDVVGVCAGRRALGIESLGASALPLGEGWVESEHGRLPLPAPAVVEILAEAGAPVVAGPGPGELTTPTGAALVASLASFQPVEMRLRSQGVGAGSQDRPWPNVARLLLGEPAEGFGLVELATNLDDLSPELVAAAAEALLAAGARDVWCVPAQMKKGRSGVVLHVLADAADEVRLAEMLLAETSTLGVRVGRVDRRHEAGRSLAEVETPWGAVTVKLKLREGRAVGVAPEFESCRAVAEAAGLPTREVYEAALVAGRALLES